MKTIDIKKKYTPGTIIKCLSMDDKQAVPSGTLGVVTHVDDMGTIHMAWATGSTMGLIVGVDSFEVITDSMNLVESDIEAKRYRFARVKVCELLISSLLSMLAVLLSGQVKIYFTPKRLFVTSVPPDERV